jgi:hypothetical protein
MTRETPHFLIEKISSNRHHVLMDGEIMIELDRMKDYAVYSILHQIAYTPDILGRICQNGGSEFFFAPRPHQRGILADELAAINEVMQRLTATGELL